MLQSFTSLRIEILKYGYHECLWLAITCPHEQASHADILAVGFTSRLNKWDYVPPKAIFTWRQQEQAGHELYRLRDEIRRNQRSSVFASCAIVMDKWPVQSFQV